MEHKQRLIKTALCATAAVLVKPLGKAALNFIPPSIRDSVKVIVESPEVKELLHDIADSTPEVGAGVLTEFLAHYSQKLVEQLGKKPKLAEAYIVALQLAFENLSKQSEKELQGGASFLTLNLYSYKQFFTDWIEKLKSVKEEISQGELESENLLQAKQLARMFYELRDVEENELTSWESIKPALLSWTQTKEATETEGESIPPELENFLKKNINRHVHDALAATLQNESYREAQGEFHAILELQILSLVKELKKYFLGLKGLAQIASGQFLNDGQPREFPLRARIDSLVEDLANKEIYIRREAVLVGQNNAEIRSLSDFAVRDGYFLLAAPAGSGKSTLMARWLREANSSPQTLGDKPELKVCYYFYSQPEGTSDHTKGITILGDQLLRAHHIQANINSFNPAAIDAIVPTSLKLDHPTRLVVIVDGLDEAGAPSTATDFLSLFKRIFPRELGHNTTVILTVRDDESANSLAHYREKLGLPLKALTLPEVSEEALAAYLTNAAVERLKEKAQDRDFLNQIIAKTEGLAIYVHYLLSELSHCDEAQGAATIEALPKGFGEYVSNSLPKALDGNPKWEAALTFIAIAQAPLTERDLIALTELSGHKLGRADFDRVNWHIKRWLRNEGDSWAFTHQKISEVFDALYVADDRATYKRHLLAYCAQWEKHESRYVLQNYAELLRREGRERESYELAGKRKFLDLQRDRLKNNPNAPLRTLRTAMLHAADKDNAVMMARFSLTHAARVKEMSEELWLEAFNSRGYLGALELADNLGNDERRVAWYLLTAWKLAVSERREEAVGTLRRLNSAFIPNLGRDEIICKAVLAQLRQALDCNLIGVISAKALYENDVDEIVQNLIKDADFIEAERLACSIKDDERQAKALINIVSALAQAHRFEEAERVARSIKIDWRQADTLADIASELAQTGEHDRASSLFAEAEQRARFVESEYFQPHALITNAYALARAGRLDEAERLARSIEHDWRQAEALSKIVSVLAQAQMLAEAEQLAHTIKNDVSQAYALTVIASTLAQAQRFDEAERLARSIKDDERRAAALTNTACALAQAQRFDEAERLARPIERDWRHADALIHLSYALAQAQRFDEAERLARSIEGDSRRDEALAVITSALAWAHRFTEAEQLAHTINDDYEQGKALIYIVAALVQAQKFDEAERLARSIEGEMSQCAVYTDIASIASALTQVQRFDEAERLARTINHDYFQSYILADIAYALAQAQRVEEAEQLANKIKDDSHQVRALINIASALAQARRFDEAERIAHTIKDDKHQAEALVGLASALAQVGEHDRASSLLDEAEKLALVRPIKHDWCHADALRDMASALAQARRFDEAERIARTITDKSYHADALRDMASALAQAHRFEEAERLARSIEYDHDQAEALSNIASALAQARRFDEAERLARTITHDRHRAEALYNIVSSLVQAQMFAEAEQIACTIEGDSFTSKGREAALARVASALARAQRFDEAERLARCVENNSIPFHVFIEIASGLTQAGEHDRASGLFDEAEQLALARVSNQPLRDDDDRAIAHVRIASWLAWAGEHDRASGLFDKAEQLARLSKSFEGQAYAFTIIVSALAQAQKFGEAERLARTIEDDERQAEALADIASALSQAKRFDEAVRFARMIKDDRHRAKALTGIASALIKANSDSEAFKIVDELSANKQIDLEAFTRAEGPEVLKKYLVSLSYDIDTALHACAQLILLYEDQAEDIYKEVQELL